MNPVQVSCEVVDAARIGEYHSLGFFEPRIAASAQPGQFVSIASAPSGRCLLRRPFSVAATRQDVVEVVFDAIGTGTSWLASRAPRDRIDVVGPLGHSFTVPEQPAVVLLVGGGYGAAPMFFLATRLAGQRIHLLLGASRRTRLLDLGGHGVAHSVTVTTEDGSAGIKGRVTDALPRLLKEERPDVVYACGPMPMLEAVAAMVDAAGVRCEIAVEEFMACGIGVCWTCVLPVRTNGSVRYQRSCTEGPVFDAAAVRWG